MALVELSLGDKSFSVYGQSLRHACDKFTNSLPTCAYVVQSAVGADLFSSFIDAVNGKDIEVTKDNVTSLGELSREFGFWRLSAKLSDFRISELEITVIENNESQEKRITALEGEVARLKSAFADAVAEAVLAERRRQLSDEVTALKSWVFPQLDSKILKDFPPIFAEFQQKRFTLLWRGTRDGFGGRDFHNRCDGHGNTLMIIEDTEGNIFGGYTPVPWESPKGHCHKGDESAKSFLFTLKNPHNVSPQKFALKEEEKGRAINCFPWRGPGFGHGCDLFVSHNCNSNSDSVSLLGQTYTNDTNLDGRIFFTGSHNFRVKEIEVFELSD
jgi:hypothetical protein